MGQLEEFRASIDTAARSVGRIQVPRLPNVPYAGTGFLVADDVVMTNCHVAQMFATQEPPGGWVFSPNSEASVDLAEDPDASPADEPIAELQIEGLTGMHDRLDLALLRVRRTGNGSMPKPLTLMSEPPEGMQNRQLYVIGYPAPDRRNDRMMQRHVFGDVYFVKRLQPGAFVVPPPGPVIRDSPADTRTPTCSPTMPRPSAATPARA